MKALAAPTAAVTQQARRTYQSTFIATLDVVGMVCKIVPTQTLLYHRHHRRHPPRFCIQLIQANTHQLVLKQLSLDLLVPTKPMGLVISQVGENRRVERKPCIRWRIRRMAGVRLHSDPSRQCRNVRSNGSCRRER